MFVNDKKTLFINGKEILSKKRIFHSKADVGSGSGGGMVPPPISRPVNVSVRLGDSNLKCSQFMQTYQGPLDESRALQPSTEVLTGLR